MYMWFGMRPQRKASHHLLICLFQFSACCCDFEEVKLLTTSAISLNVWKHSFSPKKKYLINPNRNTHTPRIGSSFIVTYLQWSKFSFLYKLDLLLILSVSVLPHYWGNPFPRLPAACQEELICDRWLLCYGRFIICNLAFPLVASFERYVGTCPISSSLRTSIIITITAIVRRNGKEAVKMVINLTIGLFKSLT